MHGIGDIGSALGEGFVDCRCSCQDEANRLHREDVRQRLDDGTCDVRVRQPAKRVLLLADSLSFPPRDDRQNEEGDCQGGPEDRSRPHGFRGLRPTAKRVVAARRRLPSTSPEAAIVEGCL